MTHLMNVSDHHQNDFVLKQKLRIEYQIQTDQIKDALEELNLLPDPIKKLLQEYLGKLIGDKTVIIPSKKSVYRERSQNKNNLSESLKEAGLEIPQEGKSDEDLIVHLNKTKTIYIYENDKWYCYTQTQKYEVPKNVIEQSDKKKCIYLLKDKSHYMLGEKIKKTNLKKHINELGKQGKDYYLGIYDYIKKYFKDQEPKSQNQNTELYKTFKDQEKKLDALFRSERNISEDDIKVFDNYIDTALNQNDEYNQLLIQEDELLKDIGQAVGSSMFDGAYGNFGIKTSISRLKKYGNLKCKKIIDEINNASLLDYKALSNSEKKKVKDYGIIAQINMWTSETTGHAFIFEYNKTKKELKIHNAGKGVIYHKKDRDGKYATTLTIKLDNELTHKQINELNDILIKQKEDKETSIEKFYQWVKAQGNEKSDDLSKYSDPQKVGNCVTKCWDMFIKDRLEQKHYQQYRSNMAEGIKEILRYRTKTEMTHWLSSLIGIGLD